MLEPHEQLKNGNALRFVKEYWFLLVFIVACAFAFSELRSMSQANHIVNEKQQTLIENNASAITTSKEAYIEDITFIKTTLEQLKNNQ